MFDWALNTYLVSISQSVRSSRNQVFWFLSMVYHRIKEVVLNSEQQNHATEVFYKKCFLKNFAKFTGKQLCQSLFLTNAASLRSASSFKKRLQHRSFPVNFAKFLRTTFLQNTWQWHLWNSSDLPLKYCSICFTIQSLGSE